MSIKIAGTIKEKGKPDILLGRDEQNNYYKSVNPLDGVFKVNSDTWTKIEEREEVIRLLELSVNKAISNE